MSHPNVGRALARALSLAAALAVFAPDARAGFAGTDVFIPAVARAGDFRSTLWITNLSTETASVQIDLLVQGRANPSPATRNVTIGAGVTKRYDDVVGDLFGLSGVGAALRIRADRDVFASSRTFDLPPGAEPKDSKGLFFAAVPKDFAIALGETAQLQGVSNGPGESFRYNFGLVETTGQGATVRVTVRDENDAPLGPSPQYVLGAYEARQVNAFAGFNPPIATTNARLEASVVSGSGKVLVYGTQIAGTGDNPGSNDSSGFEMSFKSSLLSVTGVLAGPGLAGGGSSGTVTLSIANQGVTNQMLAGGITLDKLAPALAASGGGGSGYLRIGDVQIAWGSLVPTITDFNPCIRTFAFTFPAPFVEAPTVVPGVNTRDTTGARPAGVYQFQLSPISYTGSVVAQGDGSVTTCPGIQITVNYVAFGRWR